ncbi:ankyrin repeat domain-containing protein [Candidatus Mesenet endosymbiont of Agriotes lineatus]|uniref:ankyrin repeat domain-containing protein n=1 Tax=Candidatus Mesenet endosymbiont of Agriotes lineatus TaxID=3077948 RepID=UPI0039776B5D
MIKFLIEEKANIHATNKYGATPLHNAVGYCGSIDITKLLIENGANVNFQDGAGYTPLHDAANEDDKDIVALLIENGANVNATNAGGRLLYIRHLI